MSASSTSTSSGILYATILPVDPVFLVYVAVSDTQARQQRVYHKR
jgi:hypothetical protein